ncbi:C40 family peptidase [Bacillus testis]|uniref:C40 family peptidase n=1 Tax=Bacillus testis TaxID=1622072 RepID=UPI00084105ED|nr:C40 family peptidase [Bacillus testis]
MKKVMSLFIVASIMFSFLPFRSSAAASVTGNDIVKLASQYISAPYKFGGNTPAGFDCSGYLLYVFNQVGISLPRTSADQYTSVGLMIDDKDLAPGDLVFFSDTYKKGISHSGIYIGDQKFLSATDSGVVVSSMTNSYWKPKYAGAKRVVGSQGTAMNFTDLDKGHFAYNAIAELSNKGIISGFEDGTFRPADSVTRGQAAAIINRQLKHTASSTYSYKDVNTNSVFAKDIAAMKELGIINGFADGTYRPNETMTRAQMAVIVKNAFKLKQPVASSSDAANIYSDLSPSYWAFEAIVTMNVIDLTKGFKTNVYRPLDHATRADFSAAVYNGIKAK